MYMSSTGDSSSDGSNKIDKMDKHRSEAEVKLDGNIWTQQPFCSEMTFSQTWLLFVIVVVDSALFSHIKIKLNTQSPLVHVLVFQHFLIQQTHFKALVENWATIQTVIRKLSLRGELQRGSCWVSQRTPFQELTWILTVFFRYPIWEEEGGFLRVLLLGADLPKDQGCDYVWDIITCSMLDFIGRSVIVGSVVGMSDSFVCMDVHDFQTTLYPLTSGFFYTRKSQDVLA